jgi:hypothetical protein
MVDVKKVLMIVIVMRCRDRSYLLAHLISCTAAGSWLASKAAQEQLDKVRHGLDSEKILCSGALIGSN